MNGRPATNSAAAHVAVLHGLLGLIARQPELICALVSRMLNYS